MSLSCTFALKIWRTNASMIWFAAISSPTSLRCLLPYPSFGQNTSKNAIYRTAEDGRRPYKKEKASTRMGGNARCPVAESINEYGIQLGKEPERTHGAPDTPDNPVPRLHLSILHRTNDRTEDRLVPASPGNEPTRIGPHSQSRPGDIGKVGKR